MFLFKVKSRSKNSQQSQESKVFWTLSKTLLFTGYLITLPICTLMLLTFLNNAKALTFGEISQHSTSIPWISDPSECQYTGRNWHNQKCWDNQHNLMF
ncbi:MAG: hypothetical protein KME21_10065 [Desmonostoc vinosum HA7617-LM4]|jgi:hypothetical protein|nr:hypothetical protein [Desmonostoc vinosum HA7617-LM4]